MTEFDELLQPYLSLFSGCKNPLAFFDSTLKCTGERGGLFVTGENLLSFVREPVPNPMHELTEASVYKDDRFWCCRIMPVKNSAGESEAYICEFISADAARSMSERADIASKLLPLFNAVEYNSAKIWKNTEKLRTAMRSGGNFEQLSGVLEIEAAMSNISAVCTNAYEYADMLSGSQNAASIDAGSLCRRLGEQCNAALAKCGRRIEVLIEPDDLTIYADSRRAAVALVNAVQNALLYSPRDTEPIMAVYRTKFRSREFVEIRITNENVMFTSRDFKDKVDINFSYQRLGFGVPIIERFARASGGRFSMNDENGRVVVTLTLPAAPAEYGSEIRLNSPSFTDYSTGVPELAEIMMREVVQFFGEKSEVHS